MFGLGVPELILILIIGLIVFGPGKLPTIGSALGKSLREFKDAMNAPSGNAQDAPPAAQNTMQQTPPSNHAGMEAAAKEAVQQENKQPVAGSAVTTAQNAVTPPEKNA